MKHIAYQPNNICSNKIEFDISEDNKIFNLVFHGGCSGNLKALSKLLEGKQAEHIIKVLKGNICGNRQTSCADQLTIALQEAIYV